LHAETDCKELFAPCKLTPRAKKATTQFLSVTLLPCTTTPYWFGAPPEKFIKCESQSNTTLLAATTMQLADGLKSATSL
jgi:hypothetical protein